MLHKGSRHEWSVIPGSWAPSHIAVSWKDKCHLSKHVLPFFSSHFCILSMMSYGTFCPLGSWGQLFQPYSLTTFPQAEKVLSLCKHCSAVTKSSLCFQHFSSTNPKYSTMPASYCDKHYFYPNQNQHR